MYALYVILKNKYYPVNIYNYQVLYLRWVLRFTARVFQLTDGYPEFGLRGNDEHTHFEFEYPDTIKPKLQLIKLLFGWFYVLIPHLFALTIRFIATFFIMFAVFWIILLTKNYPKKLHAFNVRLIRWTFNVYLYLAFMTDHYPGFTGKKEA